MPNASAAPCASASPKYPSSSACGAPSRPLPPPSNASSKTAPPESSAASNTSSAPSSANNPALPRPYPPTRSDSAKNGARVCESSDGKSWLDKREESLAGPLPCIRCACPLVHGHVTRQQMGSATPMRPWLRQSARGRPRASVCPRNLYESRDQSLTIGVARTDVRTVPDVEAGHIDLERGVWRQLNRLRDD